MIQKVWAINKGFIPECTDPTEMNAQIIYKEKDTGQHSCVPYKTLENTEK